MSRSRVSICPLPPMPLTVSRSQTEAAGVGLAGSCTASTAGDGVMQPATTTGPLVGSAVTLNRLGPSLRTKTSAPIWVAFSPGTSVAVLTMTLMGVAYFTQTALGAGKVIMLPLTVAVQALR